MAQRQYHKTAQRRQSILQAALEVFGEKSLAAATMEDIRARSGASTGSIYHHFQGKEHLVAALYLEAAGALHDAVRAALAAAAEAEAGLLAIVSGYLGWFEANATLGRFMLQAAGTEYVAAASARIYQEAAELEALVLDWLRPLIAAGAVADLPPAMYLPLIIGPCREIIKRWQVGALDLAQVRLPLARAVWRSLAPPATQAVSASPAPRP